MDSPSDGLANNSVGGPAVVSQGNETVEGLKEKIQRSGDSMNHVDHAEQNGHANLPNDVDKKEKSKHESSSSKHSSSGKHSSSHSSSSSKHKDGHSSSSSKHRDGHSSSSSKSKDGHSSSSKHREGGSSSSSSKHKEGSSSSGKHKEGSSSSSKHKDGSSSSSSSKHKESSSSSSSSKHKEGSSSSSSHKSKDGSSSSSKHKDGSSSSSKHRDGSSSSSKHKDGHSSSSSSSKHKDSKHSSSSSSSKDRPRESGSSSSDKEKSKHKEGSDKHKERPKESSKDGSPTKSKDSVEKIKTEPVSPTKSPSKSPSKEASPSKSPRGISPVKSAVKEEPLSDDDLPLSARVKEKPAKRPHESDEDDDDDDDVPLSSRVEKEKAKKVKTEVKQETPKSAKKRKQVDSDDEKPLKKKKKKVGKTEIQSPQKKVKKEEGQNKEVWKWWEEDRREDGVKWSVLEHKGPVFAPDYEPLPDNVKFYYNGKVMKLSQDAEEVATFYSKMLDNDYTTKDVFNNNFMKDWRKVMTSHEREKITDLSKCNFSEISDYFKMKSEERKNLTKDQKQKIKLENEEIMKEYGFCNMDGHTEKIGNFKIEPPGLFRGRGDHPKQGMLKRRTMPEDVIINCSKGSKIPVPPEGHKWKEVRHDNKVTWLACWNENIQGQTKYVMLNAASRLKGEKDWQKYETARNLYKCVDKIRMNYREDWKSKEMRIRQRAVALYFIDKLALRAGNEKEEGETADTVGCCSLRVEHLTLHEKLGNDEYVVEFDFLGKDSIRYYNSMPVEKRVYKNLELFMENKSPDDDLFDRLNTTILNKHLQDLMPGLTAKVFRTFNASRTLQEQLNLLTEEDDAIPAKLLAYNRANRAVAVLCNHQRAAPKNFSKQMENLQNKIDEKKNSIKDAKKLVKEAKSDYKATKTERAKVALDKRKKQQQRLEEQLVKLEVQATDKEENKEIALGTSKLNYLDPRISVAWVKKWEVPIEKIYNRTQRDKFRWAIDMAGPEFEF